MLDDERLQQYREQGYAIGSRPAFVAIAERILGPDLARFTSHAISKRPATGFDWRGVRLYHARGARGRLDYVNRSSKQDP